MTRDDLIAGLRTLNAPDQGMNYHGGGAVDGPRFDERTGERLPPRYKEAEITLHGERARFIYSLIANASALAAALRAQPQAREDAHPVAGDWKSIAMWMGFAASVIKSGEPWTSQCQREFDEAKAAYARLSITHPAPDALRVAVEAIIERVRSGASGTTVQALGALSDIEQIALAALQAEQGAK